MSEYKKYIFTFGANQLHEGKRQTIYATNKEEARLKMQELYGPYWCGQYTVEEWNEWTEKAKEIGISIEEELNKPIYVGGNIDGK